METLLQTTLVGVIAILIMDLTAWARQRFWGVAGLDYAFVGRWIGHMRHGRFTHPSIVKADPIHRERALGWAVHYLSGIGLALGLLALSGPHWLSQSAPWLCLSYGVGTVLLPFLLMQPAFGLGVAASKTRQPSVARGRSLISHLSFGVGLWLASLVIALV